MKPITVPTDFIANDKTLSGKNILITGAGSEISRHLCIAAAQAGATLLLLDRKQRQMAPIYDDICSKGLSEPLIIEFDMVKSDTQAFENLKNALNEAYPKIHGLVHNALWGAPLTPTAHAEMETWSKVLDQQLIKPMYLTRTISTALTSAPDASIIFSTMDIGRKGRAYWGAIGSAFAGLENFSEIVAEEFQNSHIRCNTLDTGKVRSAIRKQFYPGENIADLKEPNDPAIINSYLYLLSDTSKPCSGKRFIVG